MVELLLFWWIVIGSIPWKMQLAVASTCLFDIKIPSQLLSPGGETQTSHANRWLCGFSKSNHLFFSRYSCDPTIAWIWNYYGDYLLRFEFFFSYRLLIDWMVRSNLRWKIHNMLYCIKFTINFIKRRFTNDRLC